MSRIESGSGNSISREVRLPLWSRVQFLPTVLICAALAACGSSDEPTQAAVNSDTAGAAESTGNTDTSPVSTPTDANNAATSTDPAGNVAADDGEPAGNAAETDATDAPDQPEVVADNTTQRCDALNSMTVAQGKIKEAVMVAATDSAPAYCKVSGLILPKLNFEVRLPDNWNKKLHYSGGGGYNGSIPGPDLRAIAKGYVDIASDSGHQGSGLSADFALDDEYAANLFGSLSVPTVLDAAKLVVTARYNDYANYVYFEGCSNGGREALMSAQRYPYLFDGIISRAPAYNWTGLLGAGHVASQLLAQAGGMSAAKVSLLSTAVLQACDSSDGLVDGVVANHQACSFDPAVLRCDGGANSGDSCLSDAQLATINARTSPIEFDGGNYTYPGWPLSGGESAPGAWATWVTGANGAPGLGALFADTTVRNYLAKDPGINSLSYTYDSNPAALFGLASLNDATNADLRPYWSTGAKLILWHGTNDPAISYLGTQNYYEQLKQVAGSQTELDYHARLYIAPGVNHCAGGPGADLTDLLDTLDSWVTQGNSPGDLVAAKLDAETGGVKFTRPLCRYPTFPMFIGGDESSAASFSCEMPVTTTSSSVN